MPTAAPPTVSVKKWNCKATTAACDPARCQQDREREERADASGQPRAQRAGEQNHAGDGEREGTRGMSAGKLRVALPGPVDKWLERVFGQGSCRGHGYGEEHGSPPSPCREAG